ncbi:Retrovirus-related Pol polyprotein from transposon TNT 1-94 [Linum perenne]
MRLRTQAHLDNLSTVAPGTVFATHKSRPQFLSQSQPTTPAQNNNNEIQCRHCQEPGHYYSHCRKRNICTYCKKSGHIITDCQKRALNNACTGRGNHGTGNQGGTSYSVSDMGSISPSILATNASLDTLVQSALQRVLPQALNSAFASIGISGTSNQWFVDSASLNHMTGSRELFRDYNVEVANGQCLPIEGIATVTTPHLVLPNTLHVPALVPNLVFVGQLTENGCLVSFGEHGCVVQDRRTKRRIRTGSKRGRNFILDRLEAPISALGDVACSNKLSFSVNSSSNKLWQLWHSRLGHPHSARLMDMFNKQKLAVPFNTKNFVIPDCVDCIEAKTVALPFHSSTSTVSDMFDLIHTDFWGPCSTTSRLGFRYFALFIDHKSWFVWVYFLRLKSDLTTVLQDFVAMVKTQFQKTIKIVRSDPGGEFTSTALHEFYRREGILFQQSCPGVSEQNGLVERKHRHILDLTRAILIQSRVPPQFWVEAIRTVVFLINRQPTPVLDHLSPFEIVYSRSPDYSRLRVFGCTCFVLLPKKDRTKLAAKTVRCVFLGYTNHHKGYLCYDPRQRRIYTAYHVVFQEHLFHYHNPTNTLIRSAPLHLPSFDDSSPNSDSPSLSPPTHQTTPNIVPTPQSSTSSSRSHTFIPTHQTPTSLSHATSNSHTIIPTDHQSPHSPSHATSTSPSHTTQDSHPSHDLILPATSQPRRSGRLTQGNLPPRYTDYVTYATSGIPIPTTYKQAKDNPNWQHAMQIELEVLHDNQTSDLVPRPTHAPVIGSQWVYTAKFHPDGTLDRYKSRLVAQGFRQEYGIDYEETFAPVAKMQTVRVLHAQAAHGMWPLYQLDVKNAFLHGNLKEIVYMECPPGYHLSSPNMVCLLWRSLYGLKQAPRAWFDTLSLILASDFEQSQNDPSLFTKRTENGITILLIYVDDMILTGSDTQGITEIRRIMSDHFKLKDLGELSFFLGIHVLRSSSGILMTLDLT